MHSRDPFNWEAVLSGEDPGIRRFRRLFRRIPRAPRCKMCAAPFEGPGAPLMRAIGRAQWARNPHYCRICETWIEHHPGGAETDLSFLFADIRGSTRLGESMSASAFTALLNRFYAAGTRVVVEHEGIVDKFVGDEIVAFFATPFAGHQHAAAAVAAARELLAATGHGDPGGPWVPIGIGVHTGRAFVGTVGEGRTTEFTALGDVVNTTARLASAAGPGEVLVSRVAATAAGLEAGAGEERRLELRGRSEPVAVVVLRAEAP